VPSSTKPVGINIKQSIVVINIIIVIIVIVIIINIIIIKQLKAQIKVKTTDKCAAVIHC